MAGSGSGIGRAIALALYRGGAETYALSLRQSGLDSLAVEAPGIHTVCQDITKWSETKDAIQSILAKGTIDLLVFNAGVAVHEETGKITKENSDFQFNTNIQAGMNITQEVAMAMKSAGKGGSIVFMSSIVSHKAIHGYASYCATKAGLDAAARAMALELGPDQIRVNCVNPGLVWTPMAESHWAHRPQELEEMRAKIPMGRFVEVKDVVNSTLYLLSDKSDMISGTIIQLDGGQSAW